MGFASSKTIAFDWDWHKDNGKLGGDDFAFRARESVQAEYGGRVIVIGNTISVLGADRWLMQYLELGSIRRELHNTTVDRGAVLGYAGGRGEPSPHLHELDPSRIRRRVRFLSSGNVGSGTPGTIPIPSTGKSIDMFHARHPNGGIALVGELSYQFPNMNQYNNNVASGIPGYSQHTVESFQQLLADVDTRAAYLTARLGGASGSTVDPTAIAAKVEANLVDDFARLSAQIAEINEALGEPTEEEIANAADVDAIYAKLSEIAAGNAAFRVEILEALAENSVEAALASVGLRRI